MFSMNINPQRPPRGHSAIEAFAEARVLRDAGGWVRVMLVSMGPMFDLVKLSATSDTHSLYVECSRRDAALILAELGCSAADNVSDMVSTFMSDGSGFSDAVELASSVTRHGSRPVRQQGETGGA